MIRREGAVPWILAIAFLWTATPGYGFVIDFSTEDDGVTPLVNGQSVSSPEEFGTLFNLSSSGAGNLGLSIYDSTPGFNGSTDDDLQVDLGNLLILQWSGRPTQTVPGFFDEPNDAKDGGIMIFDFLFPVEMTSVALIDINGGGQSVFVTLTDVNGLTRTYDVPGLWTNDISKLGPDGYDTLDMTTLLPQLGEGGSTATAAQDAGFDPTMVIRATFDFESSGGLDNFIFTPEPGTFATFFAATALLCLRRRR